MPAVEELEPLPGEMPVNDPIPDDAILSDEE